MHKTKLILLLLFVLTTGITVAQNQTDSIEVTKKMGTVFMQNGKRLTPKQLLEITEISPEAYEEMKLAKTNYDTGFVLGLLGGGFVGFPIGTSLGGGDPNWALAGIGAGLIAISIPLSSAYVKHTKKAVSIYNGELIKTNNETPKLSLNPTPQGIGIRLTF